MAPIYVLCRVVAQTHEFLRYMLHAVDAQALLDMMDMVELARKFNNTVPKPSWANDGGIQQPKRAASRAQTKRCASLQKPYAQLV
jgi:hypothetical protein